MDNNFLGWIAHREEVEKAIKEAIRTGELKYNPKKFNQDEINYIKQKVKEGLS